ncbi:hypothetical protein [Ferrimonas lipolytica]|uniref:Uncharacterized protein n=1 Tax=Ferrimonas lipolytica TaxID=2724191 RepID=A0A6H1UBM8_9GAMM|nr:hypothetical protein [Ferrimonas lipolytica]QIZ76461.1 hypothetical protein HER31_06045 [Ferrimonas lipolytica]
MLTFITIFTIITGTASLLGFIYIFWGLNEQYKTTCKYIFSLAFIWSAYILFFPSSIVENVAGNISFYQSPTIENPSKNLIIQRGEFSVSENEPVAIEFPFPFKEAPKVEIINTNAHKENFIPNIKKITAHQVVFQSSSYGGFALYRTYKWVARGIPLESANK